MNGSSVCLKCCETSFTVCVYWAYAYFHIDPKKCFYMHMKFPSNAFVNCKLVSISLTYS